MKFDDEGVLHLDSDKCRICQLNKGEPHLCGNCQWHRSMAWEQTKEDDYRKSFLTKCPKCYSECIDKREYNELHCDTCDNTSNVRDAFLALPKEERAY